MAQIADQYHKTMDQKATQMALLEWNKDVTLKIDYTFDYNIYTSTLAAHNFDTSCMPRSSCPSSQPNCVCHCGKVTDIPMALNAATDLVNNDPNTRINDQTIRKVAFFLTDGGMNRGFDGPGCDAQP